MAALLIVTMRMTLSPGPAAHKYRLSRSICSALAVFCLAVHQVSSQQQQSCDWHILSTDLVIVSIGSVVRWKLRAAQNETFGQHVEVVQYTEEDFPSCVRCRWENWRHEMLYVHPVEGVFRSKSEAWFCAQQRPMLALQRLLSRLTTLPRWLMVIDDDTMVNPFNLWALMDSHDPSEPLYLGWHSAGHRTFAFGGAGWLVSQRVLQDLTALSAVDQMQFRCEQNCTWAAAGNRTRRIIDECVDRQLGGYWCFGHSDHVIAWCLKTASGIGPKLTDGFSFNRGGCSTPGWISCHYNDPRSMHGIYDKLLLRRCKQEMERQAGAIGNSSSSLQTVAPALL